MNSSRGVLIAPSILTADFGRLGDEVSSVTPYVDWFHLDVMDGHYVPNLSFGPAVVEAVARATERPIHVHLMMANPLDFAGAFASAGARRISFHPEVVDDVTKAIETVKETGAGVGLAVHPDVDVERVRPHLAALDVVLMMTVRPGFGGQQFLSEVVPKIARARSLVDEAGVAADVEVDGGVNLKTVHQPLAAGASILVVGSAIFDGVDPVSAARRMRAEVDRLSDAGGSRARST